MHAHNWNISSVIFNRESTCNALCKYYLPLLPQIDVVPLPLKIFIYFHSTSESNIWYFLIYSFIKFQTCIYFTLGTFSVWNEFLNSSSLFEVPGSTVFCNLGSKVALWEMKGDFFSYMQLYVLYSPFSFCIMCYRQLGECNENFHNSRKKWHSV